MQNSLILKSEIEPGGRLKLQALNGYGELVQINGEDTARSLAKFNWSITVGIEATFDIATSHFSDTYNVSTKNGTVHVAGNQVKYVPATVGVGGFLLNGTMHVVDVIKNAPVRPTLLSPTTGGISPTVYPVLSSSAYNVDDTTIVQSSSRWQIATDPEFVNIVVDVESTTALTALKSPLLIRGVTYYARVMHIGTKP